MWRHRRGIGVVRRHVLTFVCEILRLRRSDWHRWAASMRAWEEHRTAGWMDVNDEDDRRLSGSEWLRRGLEQTGLSEWFPTEHEESWQPPRFRDADFPVDPEDGVIAAGKGYGFLPLSAPGIGLLLEADILRLDPKLRDSGQGDRLEREAAAEHGNWRQYRYRRESPGCWRRWDGTRVESSWAWAPEGWVERGDQTLSEEALANLHLLERRDD